VWNEGVSGGWQGIFLRHCSWISLVVGGKIEGLALDGRRVSCREMNTLAPFSHPSPSFAGPSYPGTLPPLLSHLLRQWGSISKSYSRSPAGR
jgi:hypothetical protein